MKKKWSLDTLTENCKNNNIQILSLNEQEFNEETIHVYSRIKGLCTLSFCENHWDKSFKSLMRTKNCCCKKHSRTGKHHLQYVKLLLEIKEKLPHINIKFKKKL